MSRRKAPELTTEASSAHEQQLCSTSEFSSMPAKPQDNKDEDPPDLPASPQHATLLSSLLPTFPPAIFTSPSPPLLSSNSSIESGDGFYSPFRPLNPLNAEVPPPASFTRHPPLTATAKGVSIPSHDPPAVPAQNQAKRTSRCRECVACLRPNCGICSNCLDMPKFGGKGHKKQCCRERRCTNRVLSTSRSSVPRPFRPRIANMTTTSAVMPAPGFPAEWKYYFTFRSLDGKERNDAYFISPNGNKFRSFPEIMRETAGIVIDKALYMREHRKNIVEQREKAAEEDELRKAKEEINDETKDDANDEANEKSNEEEEEEEIKDRQTLNVTPPTSNP